MPPSTAAMSSIGFLIPTVISLMGVPATSADEIVWAQAGHVGATVEVGQITLGDPRGELRFMTIAEQRVMKKALWRSVRVVE